MGVVQKGLSPGMQYGDKANLRSKVSAISTEFLQGLRNGTKKNAVNRLPVPQGDGPHFFGERENDMKIWNRK
jgi:hypothetical protein